jgi:hypothetical protein
LDHGERDRNGEHDQPFLAIKRLELSAAQRSSDGVSEGVQDEDDGQRPLQILFEVFPYSPKARALLFNRSHIRVADAQHAGLKQ